MAWYDMFNPAGPAQKRQAGARLAASSEDRLAQEQRDFYMKGLGQAQSQYTGLQGAYGQVYGPGGSGAGPGALEQYYADTQNKSDPYFNRVLSEGNAALGASFSAQGGFGSGARLATQAYQTSALESEMYQRRAAVAAAAEQAQQARYGQQFGIGAGLAGAQAGLTMGGYGMAGGAYERAKQDAIMARMQAAGYSGEGLEAMQRFAAGTAKAGLAAGEIGFGGPAAQRAGYKYFSG